MITSAKELHLYSGSDWLLTAPTAILRHCPCLHYCTRSLASCSQFLVCKSSTLSPVPATALSSLSFELLLPRNELPPVSASTPSLPACPLPLLVHWLASSILPREPTLMPDMRDAIGVLL